MKAIALGKPNILAWFETIHQDVRYGLRTLRSNRELMLVAALSLGLGIGANLTVFSLISEILLKAPTASQPERLVQVEVGRYSQMSYPNYRDLQQSRVFEGLAAYTSNQESWIHTDTTDTVRSYLVSANFFEVLGVQAVLGRTFMSEEAVPERDPQLIVVSHRFYQSRLNADPKIVGRSVNLNGKQFTVLGVLPANYRSLAGFGEAPALYIPISSLVVNKWSDRDSIRFFVVARLARNVTRGAAQTALAVAARQLEDAYPKENKGFGTVRRVMSLSGLGRLQRYGPEEQLFTTFLLIVVGLVLLIACANVASLLLAKGVNRRREIAMRLALGASRWRLVQQLLMETLLVALLSTGVGLLLFLWLIGPLKQIQIPFFGTVDLQLAPDATLLTQAAVLAFLTTLICGLAPALQSTRLELLSAIKDQPIEFVYRRLTLRNCMVVGQVAASVVLLTTGFLFLRSLLHMSALDPGFDSQHTLALTINPVRGRHTPQQEKLLFQQAVERIQALPRVRSATTAAIVPLSFNSTGTWMWLQGREDKPRVLSNLNAVGPHYFETLGIPLLRGRTIQSSDAEGAPRAAVINDAFARRYFAAEDPIGRHLVLGENKDMLVEIVGVVRTSKHLSLGEKPTPLVYLSSLQPQPFRRVRSLLVRTAGAPESSLKAVRGVIAELDPTAGVQIGTMRDTLSFSLFPSRIGAVLLGSLGGLGLILAVVGLYGVMVYAVSRRTREIGIRMALGASRTNVSRMVLKDGVLLVGYGASIGLVIALFATVPLRTFLAAGVGSADPITFAGVTLVLTLVGVGASLVPAYRATKVDPIVALRYE